MNVPDVVLLKQRVDQVLAANAAQLSESIITGSLDVDQYKTMCGQVSGLRHAMNVIAEEFSSIGREDDDAN